MRLLDVVGRHSTERDDAEHMSRVVYDAVIRPTRPNPTGSDPGAHPLVLVLAGTLLLGIILWLLSSALT